MLKTRKVNSSRVSMDDDNKFFPKGDEIEREVPETTKKTGEARKRALFVLGSAALGAFLGDTFIGRDHHAIGEIKFGGSDIAYDTNGNIVGTDHFNGVYSLEATGKDRGGIVEDIWGKDIFRDSYYMSEKVTKTYDQSIYPYRAVEENFGNWDEDYLRDHYQQTFDSGFDTITSTVDPAGAEIGFIGGTAGGFATDWLKNKAAKKKEENGY